MMHGPCHKGGWRAQELKITEKREGDYSGLVQQAVRKKQISKQRTSHYWKLSWHRRLSH